MTDPISALLLDDSIEFSLAELCATCRVTEELVVEIVAEGIVEQHGADRIGHDALSIACLGLMRSLAAISLYSASSSGVCAGGVTILTTTS